MSDTKNTFDFNQIPARATDYFKKSFVFDVKSGFITAIVALPLAIGFAIASGVEPYMGIYTAIVAGFFGSLLGGSRFSITGPTGAMGVVVLSAVTKYGLEGLFLATLLAGVIQILLGIFKVGKIAKFMPLPIIAGFTSGIGLLIVAGQIPNALGLTIPVHEYVFQTLYDIYQHMDSISLVAILITIGTAIIMLFLPRFTKDRKYISSVPPTIVALILSAVLIYFGGFEIPTIGTLPQTLPSFSLFKINFDLARNVFPYAISLTLLGTIESLMCAVVCDGMTATKHNSDRELIAQGITKMITPFFGGLPSTAAVSRSVVNIREGAKSRASGMMHSGFMLLFVIFFGSLAIYLPKAFVAGILICIGARMVNYKELRLIWGNNKTEAAIFIITMLLTVLTDLILAMEVGILLTMVNFLYDMTKTTSIETVEEHDSDDRINEIMKLNEQYKDKLAIYTINGPFFFGAMNVFDQKVNAILPTKKKVIIIRMRFVPYVDTTAISRLNGFIESRNREKRYVILTSLRPVVKKHLFRNETFEKHVRQKDVFLFESTEHAVEFAKNELFPLIDKHEPKQITVSEEKTDPAENEIEPKL
ncbi:SulP family inorganic anion transporter [Methanolapillus ohkumae]|uniref:C4-dicarboxylic acid transporter DauA n=1 Tax=Methanolapillus ohkumae TaxID=3028298 RepID=A0AA96ZX51_9EURY|nr:C4-dicarboxylic acid transporter DauA [Methanosarcinaceae archaeon Am2]